jgi:hypothetical protein
MLMTAAPWSWAVVNCLSSPGSMCSLVYRDRQLGQAARGGSAEAGIVSDAENRMCSQHVATPLTGELTRTPLMWADGAECPERTSVG